MDRRERETHTHPETEAAGGRESSLYHGSARVRLDEREALFWFGKQALSEFRDGPDPKSSLQGLGKL